MRSIPALAWMSLSSLGFAVMSAMVKVLASDLGQFWMVLLRTGITALIFFVILVVLRRPLIPEKGMRLLLFRGLTGFGGIACLFYGTMHLPLAIATLLNWCSLVFVILFSGIFLGERISSRSLLWIGVSIAGLLLLVIPNVFGGQEIHGHLSSVALGVGLLGAMFSAMAMVAVRAAAQRFSAELIIFYFSALAMALSAPIAVSQLPISRVAGVIFSSPQNLLSVLLLGGSGSAAQYAMTRGYAVASAGLGSSLSLLTAAFSAMIGWWFFDEKLTPIQWCGVLVLAAGVLGSGLSAARLPSAADTSGLARTPEIS